MAALAPAFLATATPLLALPRVRPAARSPQTQNIMFDRRVYRGNTYAAKVLTPVSKRLGSGQRGTTGAHAERGPATALRVPVMGAGTHPL